MKITDHDGKRCAEALEALIRPLRVSPAALVAWLESIGWVVQSADDDPKDRWHPEMLAWSFVLTHPSGSVIFVSRDVEWIPPSRLPNIIAEACRPAGRHATIARFTCSLWAHMRQQPRPAAPGIGAGSRLDVRFRYADGDAEYVDGGILPHDADPVGVAEAIERVGEIVVDGLIRPERSVVGVDIVKGEGRNDGQIR